MKTAVLRTGAVLALAAGIGAGISTPAMARQDARPAASTTGTGFAATFDGYDFDSRAAALDDARQNMETESREQFLICVERSSEVLLVRGRRNLGLDDIYVAHVYAECFPRRANG